VPRPDGSDGRKRWRTSTASSPPTSPRSSTAPWWGWTGASCFEALGRRRLRHRPARAPRLLVPGRPAAALLAPVPLLHERPAHLRASASARLSPVQRRVAYLGGALDDRAPVLPLRGAGLFPLRSPPRPPPARPLRAGRGHRGGGGSDGPRGGRAAR